MKKIRKSQILRIEDDNGTVELMPGDIYELTLNITMVADKLSGNATITAKYSWDGKILKQLMQ